MAGTGGKSNSDLEYFIQVQIILISFSIAQYQKMPSYKTKVGNTVQYWIPKIPLFLTLELQKRKLDQANEYGANTVDEPDTSKPSAVFTATGGRQYTLSIALPGSIIAK